MAVVRSPALPATEPTPNERAERLAHELEASYAARGRLYWHMLVTLREELGEAAAERVLSRAIQRHGEAAGAKIFAGLEDASPMGIAARFLTVASADWGRLFPHELSRADDGAVTIRVKRCPLKAAWEADGRTPAEIAQLCRIAGAADRGVFTGHGCGFGAETWQEGREGCCVLRLTPG
jgi:hypothetical protein